MVSSNYSTLNFPDSRKKGIKRLITFSQAKKIRFEITRTGDADRTSVPKSSLDWWFSICPLKRYSPHWARSMRQPKDHVLTLNESWWKATDLTITTKIPPTMHRMASLSVLQRSDGDDFALKNTIVIQLQLVLSARISTLVYGWWTPGWRLIAHWNSTQRLAHWLKNSGCNITFR